MLLINTVPLYCINQAAEQYHIPVVIILSVLKTEDGYAGLAKENHNGSFDYGPFQINSYWLPKLSKYKITQKDLQYNSCKNAQIAVWILSKNIADSTYFNQGLGNYNSITPWYNTKYFYRVSKKYYNIKQAIYG